MLVLVEFHLGRKIIENFLGKIIVIANANSHRHDGLRRNTNKFSVIFLHKFINPNKNRIPNILSKVNSAASETAGFAEAGREFLSPQPPFLPAPPERKRLGIFQKMVSSRTVKIHQNLTFRKLTDFFVGGAQRRPSISPRQILSARRAQARLAVGQDEVRLPCDLILSRICFAQ